MSDVVIRVENLSKSYLVGHFAREQRNAVLRDVIARGTASLARKAVDLVRGRQIVQGDKVEEFWALKDVSLDVKQGEVLGIIGRNGAGKSTLLKILSRITDPTAGRIVIRGRVASLLEVGTGFHPELTGRENIFLNGAILGMTQREIRRKFDEIVAFAEVDKFLDTPVKRYSSGMYVRLAFAVAAHLEPEILIVDEVLAVGDAEFQKKCLGKMRDVATREGRTVLFVSHNHGAIRSLCTHALLLRSGRSTQKEEAVAALARYSSEYGAASSTQWDRPPEMPTGSTWFRSINVRLKGAQPTHRLECACEISARSDARPVFIAVDFFDANLAPIMQAEPKVEPFIGGARGLYRVELSIDLPALVPGRYWLDFWLGTHNTQTVDYVRRAVAFEVVDNPNPRRSFPYTLDHGFIAPPSRVSVVELKSEPIETRLTDDAVRGDVVA